MKLLARATLLILVLILNGCALGGAYSAKSIEGWVVDNVSKKPLDGVVVVAGWMLEGGPFELQSLEYLTVMETVTDAAGRYAFPAWGPKSIPKHLPLNAHFVARAPGLDFFKSGYQYDYRSNELIELDRFGPSVRDSRWNGKTIALKPASNMDERRSSWTSLESALYTHNSAKASPCYWRQIPNLITAEYREFEMLVVAKMVSRSNFESRLQGVLKSEKFGEIPAECGSPKTFFEGLMK